MTKQVFIGYTKKQAERRASVVIGQRIVEYFKDLGVWKVTVVKSK